MTIKYLLDTDFPSLVYKMDQLLSEYTTMKVGGTVEFMIFPSSLEILLLLLKSFRSYQIPYFILGKGSNIIVNDEGLDLVVINMESLNHIAIDPEDPLLIHAEAGVSLEELSCFALEHSLTGLEFASGIPGTVGGAVFMNAGAYGSEIKDVLESSLIFIEDSCVFSNKEHEFTYRSSAFMRKPAIILKSSFRVQKGDILEIQTLMGDLKRQRIEKQPLEYPSAGSTFKRPEGYFAGKLITDAGLKGVSVGGASVSRKHAGFIINNNHAKARDILDLIRHIQLTVDNQFHVHLEPEVRFLEKDGTFRIFS
ncbi:MAG: UDP-N-acetylmuramate dehydrogenase [Brevinema sp.]